MVSFAFYIYTVLACQSFNLITPYHLSLIQNATTAQVWMMLNWCAFTSTACKYLAKTFHKLSICCKVSKQQHKTVCSQLSCFLYLSVVKVFLIDK